MCWCVEHLALLRFAGLLAQRPRCVSNLQALVADYFAIPVVVEQFQGRWLRLDQENQSRLGCRNGNSQLGTDVVLGSQVWDVQSKIRLRLGVLSYAQFQEFLPDPAPRPRRKALFLLSHLVRLFAGQELDFRHPARAAPRRSAAVWTGPGRRIRLSLGMEHLVDLEASGTRYGRRSLHRA